MEIRNRWKIFVLLILLVILISGCVDNENVVPTVEEMDNEAEGTAQNLAEPDSAETKEIWEKGYSLPLEQAIKDEAEADCKKEMEKIKNVYIEADKGEATNPILEEEALFRCARFYGKQVARLLPLACTTGWKIMIRWTHF